MAIPRIAINNINDLKSVLDDLVPDFFASVTLDTSTNTITCKDDDDNTIFAVTVSSNNVLWTPSVYRSMSSALTPSGGSSLGAIRYCYKMGRNGAILFYDGGANFRDAIAIAKAKNGKTAFVIPASSSNLGNRHARFYSACWGDDTSLTSAHVFCDSSAPESSNHCLLVPVPLFGSYDEPNYIPKVFAMLISQQNMRGVIQEVTSDDGTYITNGYVAMKYEGGDA